MMEMKRRIEGLRRFEVLMGLEFSSDVGRKCGARFGAIVKAHTRAQYVLPMATLAIHGSLSLLVIPNILIAGCASPMSVLHSCEAGHHCQVSFFPGMEQCKWCRASHSEQVR